MSGVIHKFCSGDGTCIALTHPHSCCTLCMETLSSRNELEQFLHSLVQLILFRFGVCWHKPKLRLVNYRQRMIYLSPKM